MKDGRWNGERMGWTVVVWVEEGGSKYGYVGRYMVGVTDTWVDVLSEQVEDSNMRRKPHGNI